MKDNRCKERVECEKVHLIQPKRVLQQKCLVARESPEKRWGNLKVSILRNIGSREFSFVRLKGSRYKGVVEREKMHRMSIL